MKHKDFLIDMLGFITIKGAREHNLKNIDLSIPRDAITVITGPSGSGKSSLAIDTIYAEGHRRYVESLSAYARQFLEQLRKPDVDSIEGLSPSIAIDQKTVIKNPRSTVGTITEIYDYMRVLYQNRQALLLQLRLYHLKTGIKGYHSFSHVFAPGKSFANPLTYHHR